MISTRLEVRDYPCENDTQFGFIRYYYRPGTRTLADEIPTGREIVESSEAFDIADAHLGELQDRNRNPRRFYTAAVSICRICCAHEDAQKPVLEVFSNVYAVSPDSAWLTIEGIRRVREPHDDGTGAITLAAPVVGVTREEMALEDHGPTDITYLPHSNYGFTESEHQGIIIARGGGSYPAPFGLSGYEFPLSRATYPDARGVPQMAGYSSN
jgi:hypothetical protein